MAQLGVHENSPFRPMHAWFPGIGDITLDKPRIGSTPRTMDRENPAEAGQFPKWVASVDPLWTRSGRYTRRKEKSVGDRQIIRSLSSILAGNEFERLAFNETGKTKALEGADMLILSHPRAR